MVMLSTQQVILSSATGAGNRSRDEVDSVGVGKSWEEDGSLLWEFGMSLALPDHVMPPRRRGRCVRLEKATKTK